jgi:predicted RNA methylase
VAARPWQDQVVLDLGAGTGFHLERFHRHAQQVLAVEPDGRQGFASIQVASEGRFDRREELEVEVHYCLYHRRY